MALTQIINFYMPNSHIRTRLNKRGLIWLVLLVLCLYVIVPQFHGFHASWHLLSHPNIWDVIVAMLFVIATYFAAAATYCLLAFKRLPYVQEFVIQLAAMFVNRLLPAGIGGIGANFEYLRRKGHNASEAASVVATNNVLGIIGHALLLLVTLTLTASHNVLPTTNLKHSLENTLKITVVIIAVGIILTIIFSFERFRKAIKSVTKQLAEYRHRPLRITLALLTQIGLTLTNVLSLSFSALAVGIHLSFLVIFIIFTFGSGIRNITPTPGGIGGFEAGLVAGFVAYNIGGGRALAAVLLYRIVSYWLPLIAGAVAFVYAQQKHWFRA